jgi:predicted transcriptional regulator
VALEGSLKDFGLADILQLIFFQRKTGVLYLEGKLDKIRLLFIEGNISGAESKRRIDANRLGKVLVKKGLLKEEDLQSMLDEQRSRNVRIGNLLVRKGIVKKEEIAEVLTGQIKETVIQIFGWKEGMYEFTPQEVPPDKDIPISIDTQHLLMEGLRIVDEWALIEGKITLDTTFTRQTEDTSALTEEEKDILLLIDGDNDVSTIIDISGQDDYSVSKTLVSLIEKGVIESKEVLPIVPEILPIETKKPVFSSRVLPLLAIAVSVLFSLFSVFFDSGQVFKIFRASEAVDDLRFKIEAYRFEHDSYPERLDLISMNVDPWGKPFIYKHNNYTFIVLSTGADGREGTADDIY